jgi:predicted TIM-barrel fold metal-dependent hydrolase
MRNTTSAASPSQPMTPINFEVPAGACDCHTHIHGDPQLFPFFSGRTYTPEPALPEELARLHKALSVERVVIVTPSVYGTDNRATLFGMKSYGKNARGVAVIDEKTPKSQLDEMGRAGICGIRLNLASSGINDPAIGRQRLKAAIDRLRERSWHIQIFTNLPMIASIKDLVAGSPLNVVVDHFGGLRAELGLEQPGFADLVELVKSGRAYVKISAAYRISQSADYADVAPLARALIAANPERILWGTDWPHPNSVTPAGRKPTEVTPLLDIDDGRLMNELPKWVPDAALRKIILVDNPERLYGF